MKNQIFLTSEHKMIRYYEASGGKKLEHLGQIYGNMILDFLYNHKSPR